jgi:hypothetical protein
VVKGRDSSKSKRNIYHAKRGEYGVASGYDHHLQRKFVIRTHNSPSLSPIRKHIRISRVDELQGEFKKIKNPTIDAENKKDKDVETWILGMRKYFRLHNYSSWEEGRISIYWLEGKTSMWWDQLMQVQHIDEKNITLM